MTNYIQHMRSKIGSAKFIHPGARIIIENDKKEILVIERRDNGKMGLPAGAIENGETITECIIREVKEETGLDLIEVEVIGISSNPTNETVKYPNGDEIQYFTIEFYATNWTGEIRVIDTNEVSKARFVDSDLVKSIPKNERSTLESLAYYKKYKRIMLK